MGLEPGATSLAADIRGTARSASSFPPSTKPRPSPRVIREIPRDLAREVIVADGGSTDGTRTIARVGRGQRCGCRAGLRSGLPGRRGGRPGSVSSCSWTAMAPIVATCWRLIAGPVLAGTHDFVLASRTRGATRSGFDALAPGAGGTGRRMGDRQRCMVSATATCALSGQSGGTRCGAEYAGDDLWLEYRDADEGRTCRPAYQGNSVALSLPRGRRVEGRRIGAGHAASRRQDRVHVFPGRCTAAAVPARLTSQPAWINPDA